MTSNWGLFLIAYRPQIVSDTEQCKIPNICFLPVCKQYDCNLQGVCQRNI